MRPAQPNPRGANQPEHDQQAPARMAPKTAITGQPLAKEPEEGGAVAYRHQQSDDHYRQKAAHIAFAHPTQSRQSEQQNNRADKEVHLPIDVGILFRQPDWTDEAAQVLP